jgi:hypothetical protein
MAGEVDGARRRRARLWHVATPGSLPLRCSSRGAARGEARERERATDRMRLLWNERRVERRETSLELLVPILVKGGWQRRQAH